MTPISGGDLVWLAAALAGLLWTVGVATERSLPVLLPLVGVAVSASAFYLVLSRTSGSATPCLEIGGVYVAVVSLYGLYPLAGFIANGLTYTPFSDNRLYSAHPTPAEIGGLGWYYVAHLAAFAAAYLLARGRAPALEPRWRRPGLATVLAAVILYAAISAYLFFLHWALDLSASTYAGTYAVWRQVPLELAQLANHLGGIRLPLEFVLLAVLFARYERWRWLIAAWLAVGGAAAFVRLGSRTEFVWLIGAVALMYHYLVRPLRLRHALAGGAVTLVAFDILGMLRAGLDPLALTAVNPLFGHNTEFEVVFANAYHLGRQLAAGAVPDIPSALRLADLLALVPQQLIPVEKVNPADWYVWTFFPVYAARGGGFVFGTIAEAVLGAGWVEAAGRGAALGVALAWLHRAVVRRPSSFWAFILYVWVSVQIYHSVRATTFMLLGYFVYRFVPAAVAVAVLAAVLREATRRPRLPRPGRAEVVA